MKAAITGGAGFIGSAVSKTLSKMGWEITVFDNMSSGSKDSLIDLDPGSDSEPIRVIVGDCTRVEDVGKAIRGSDVIFHFAANPEVRIDRSTPEECFRQNIYATHNVLEAFRESTTKLFVFASTSTVYGEATKLPTPEDYTPLDPISIYGASKLAGETLVSSYCRTFGKRGTILRFANVIGPNSKHGVVTEFVSMLNKNPGQLTILGDGTQNKSYIHIDDCVEAVIAAVIHGRDQVEVFNIGSKDSVTVREIGNLVAKNMGLTDVDFKINGGLEDGRGWVGDVKNMRLDVSKLRSKGWTPKLTSSGAVEQTVIQIMQNRDNQ